MVGPRPEFLALLDLDNVHGTCRLCVHAADRIAGEAGETLRGQVKTWGLCRAKDPATGQVTRLVEVRERGRYYFKPVLLREEDLTVRGLHLAIVKLFEGMNYKPIFTEVTPRCDGPPPLSFPFAVFHFQG